MVTEKERALIRKGLTECIVKILEAGVSDKKGRTIIEVLTQPYELKFVKRFRRSEDGGKLLIASIDVKLRAMVDGSRLKPLEIQLRVRNKQPIAFDFDREKQAYRFESFDLEIIEQQ